MPRDKVLGESSVQVQEHPLVYEVNTRSWLRELSEKRGAAITLADVTETEFDRWQHVGFTHIWLMGVWQIGRRSRDYCRRLATLRETAAQSVTDLRDDDIVGSPYAVAGYQAAQELGGESALQQFRGKLTAHGLKLILDFIPNHTGLDHPWLGERPELFVQSPSKRPGTFLWKTPSGPRRLAHGKDPFFAPWADTVQLDYRNPATHTTMIKELKSVARRCDGVRCDMAMLVLEDVFKKNWSEFPCPKAADAGEFWQNAITAIKETAPDFLFLGEVYWDLEPRLQSLGFDYTYDKRLCDHLVARQPYLVQRRLLDAEPAFVQRSAHFLENHDEPRIASLLSLAEHRAAALLVLGLPGMRMLHDGQIAGATKRASVHLNRRPQENPQPEIAACYKFLLAALQATAVGKGHATLPRPAPAGADNPTAQNIVIVQWQATPLEFDLVVANLAPHPSQCCVPLQIDGLAPRNWQMTNLLGPERFEHRGADLQKHGLYLDVPAHGAQLFHFQPVSR